MNEQRKWFLGMESTPGEDALKIIEMTTKDLEYYINIVDKAVAGLERIDSNFGRTSTVSKMLSNSTVYYREIIHERKSHLIWQTSFLCYFKKLSQLPQSSSNHHLDQSAAINIEARPSTSKKITTC